MAGLQLLKSARNRGNKFRRILQGDPPGGSPWGNPPGDPPRGSPQTPLGGLPRGKFLRTVPGGPPRGSLEICCHDPPGDPSPGGISPGDSPGVSPRGIPLGEPPWGIPLGDPPADPLGDPPFFFLGKASEHRINQSRPNDPQKKRRPQFNASCPRGQSHPGPPAQGQAQA